jgi:hypothetical protein
MIISTYSNDEFDEDAIIDAIRNHSKFDESIIDIDSLNDDIHADPLAYFIDDANDQMNAYHDESFKLIITSEMIDELIDTLLREAE